MENIIDFATFPILWGSYMLFWVMTLLTIIVISALEKVKAGWYGLLTISGFFTLLHFFSNVGILNLFTYTNILLYVGIGFAYSLIRTYLFGRKEYKKIGDAKYDLKDNIFIWWFYWPISLLNWLVSDLVQDIWGFIYSKVYKFYNKVLEMGAQGVQKEE